MNESNYGYVITTLVILSIIVGFVLALVPGFQLNDLSDIYSYVSQIISIDTTIAFVFITWLWRLPIFRGWLVLFPDLNGTWYGFLKSNWKDANGNALPDIPFMLTIKQSFFTISCVGLTQEMRSDSYSEGFTVNPVRQIKRLAYNYNSRPLSLLQSRSPVHEGSVIFDVIEGKPNVLKGYYWTDRQTSGDIKLSYHSKKILQQLP